MRHSRPLQFLAVFLAVVLVAGVGWYVWQINEDRGFLYYLLGPITLMLLIGLAATAWTGGERWVLDRGRGKLTRGLHLGFGLLVDTTTEPLGIITGVTIVSENRGVMRKTGKNQYATTASRTCAVDIIHVPGSSRQPVELPVVYTTQVGRAIKLGHRIAWLLKVTPRESRIR